MVSLSKLKKKLTRTNGRNNQGVITVYHRGGGHKRLYRIVDFRRSLFNVDGVVKKIEYDPNRSSDIALIYYQNGLLSYVLSTTNLSVGNIINSGPNANLQEGCSLPLSKLPVGCIVHNIELKPGAGGQLMRSAGCFAKIIRKTNQNILLRLHTGKLYSVSPHCMATLGIVSNELHHNKKMYKAGQNRWKGIRPTTRGVAMNPVDHPHGGGEGRSKGGRHPSNPWGKLTKGFKTVLKSKK